jgi:hypothetical protein
VVWYNISHFFEILSIWGPLWFSSPTDFWGYDSLSYISCSGIYHSKAEHDSEIEAQPWASKARIKKYADNKRIEREFSVGDMVYLRLQLFRHAAFGIHQSLKLTTRFYGPFRLMERIDKVAYRLQLSESTDIHPVFHVSQLKKHLGTKVVSQPNLPLVTAEGYLKTEPVYHHSMVGSVTEPITRREDKLLIKVTFPEFYYKTIKWWPEPASSGQEASQGGGNCHDWRLYDQVNMMNGG